MGRPARTRGGRLDGCTRGVPLLGISREGNRELAGESYAQHLLGRGAVGTFALDAALLLGGHVHRAVERAFDRDEDVAGRVAEAHADVVDARQPLVAAEVAAAVRARERIGAVARRDREPTAARVRDLVQAEAVARVRDERAVVRGAAALLVLPGAILRVDVDAALALRLVRRSGVGGRLVGRGRQRRRCGRIVGGAD